MTMAYDQTSTLWLMNHQLQYAYHVCFWLQFQIFLKTLVPCLASGNYSYLPNIGTYSFPNGTTNGHVEVLKFVKLDSCPPGYHLPSGSLFSQCIDAGNEIGSILNFSYNPKRDGFRQSSRMPNRFVVMISCIYSDECSTIPVDGINNYNYSTNYLTLVSCATGYELPSGDLNAICVANGTAVEWSSVPTCSESNLV